MRDTLLSVVALLLACTPGPAVLAEGDSCDVCRMVITDTRFGGQVVLTTGRTKSFDAVECLVEYLATADSAMTARVLVSDYETATLIDAAAALFIEDSQVASPMGRRVVAVNARTPRDSIAARFGGRAVDLTALRRNLAAGGHDAHGR